MNVFGFFSRKPLQPPPETVPLPPSPTASISKLSPAFKVEKNPQLRTPSPSVDSTSVAHAKISSASPSTKIARLSIEDMREASPNRRSSLPRTTLTATAPNHVFVPPEPTVESLAAHLSAIPPKTLHAYVLSRISRAEADSLHVLAMFFAELSPPQKMHCVRCHKDFVEVENDDRSCLVPHDDESAEVERVGTAKRVPGTVGATYETLWECCGRIVEGDGDQGPPDGWCYEGKHTTDIKRARFRADATPHDDKLVSCLRLNCHGIRAQLSRGARSTRKRPRSMNLKEASTNEESEGGTDSGMDEIVGKSASTAGRGRPKGKGKTKAAADDGDRMDVDEPPAESASAAGSARGRARPPKSKAQAQGTASAAKRHVRIHESKVVPGTDGEDDAQSVKSAPAPKRRGRQPKSKPIITDSDREMDVEGPSAQKGKRKEKAQVAKPRPRSLSRARPDEVSDAAGGKPKSRTKKVREANDQEADAEDGDDEKPKKKRRKAVDV